MQMNICTKARMKKRRSRRRRGRRRKKRTRRKKCEDKVEEEESKKGETDDEALITQIRTKTQKIITKTESRYDQEDGSGQPPWGKQAPVPYVALGPSWSYTPKNTPMHRGII